MFYSSNEHPPPHQPCSHMRQEEQLGAGLGFAHLEMGTFRFQSPRIPYLQKDCSLPESCWFFQLQEELAQAFLKDKLF